MANGRHRKEGNNNTKKLALTAALGLGASVVPATFASSANAASLEAWEKIAQCEASGNWNINHSSDGLSVGGLQFINSSWHVALNRLEQEGVDTSDFPPNLYQGMANVPTKEQQLLAGEALLAVQGPNAWVCNWNGHPVSDGALDGQASMFEGGVSPFGSDGIPGQEPDLSHHPSVELIIGMVNDARAEVGYDPLVVDPELKAYAKAWSEQQAADGEMKHSDLSFEGALKGENVAMGQDHGAEVFEDWMNSPDHKANILNPKFTRMGVALAHDSEGEHYWTQVFASGAVTEEPPEEEPPGEEEPPTEEPPGEEEPPTEEPPGEEEPPVEVPATYTVVKGDTLYGIAERFGVPKDVPQGGIDARWHTLYNANREVVGDNPHLIFPGQVLTIPEGSQPPAEEEPEVQKYTVVEGDTLFLIADDFGVHGGWQAVYEANKDVIGDNPDLIEPGMVLTIPRPNEEAGDGPRPEPQDPPAEEEPPTEEPPAEEEPAPNPDAFPGADKFGPGANNEFVTRLGEMLLDRGAGRFYSVGAGPEWSESDRSATAAFQRAQGWTGEGANGIPGPLTWKLLVEGEGNDIPESSGRVTPVDGQPSSNGYRNPGDYTAGFHTGVDYTQPYGATVRAADDGVVVVSTSSNGAYGNFIKIRHSDGKYTLYAHLSQRQVWVGQSVNAGQKIGEVGSTGNSSGPHLHFEVRHGNGGYWDHEDPIAWLNQ